MTAPVKSRRFVAYCGLAFTLGLGTSYPVSRGLAGRIALSAPRPTLLLEDAEGRFLAELGPDRTGRGYWPVGGAPPERVLRATLAAEDARFEEHCGVDWKSVARALYQDTRALTFVQGASTLAMQVARLQAPGGRSLPRKALEAALALGLTGRFGRDAVLRHYLTIAPYGNQYHGIVYAARRYFDKPVEDLSWAEAALLASLPRLPGRMNIYRDRGRQRAERRARYVIARLRDLRWIPEDEAARALDLIPGLRLAPRRSRPPSCLHAILALERKLGARELRPQGRNPYLVRAAIDLDIQRSVSRIAGAAIPDLRQDGAGNLAVIVAEKDSARLRAYLGSADFRDAVNKGSLDYARAGHSSGSTLKPFIYALGIWLKGFTGATLLSDVGLLLDARRGGYSIKNYDGAYLGPILYRKALANSRNIPAVEVLHAVGVDRVLRHFQELGLVRRDQDAGRYGLSLALGGLNVSLFELVRAYGVLAGEGVAFEPRWLEEEPARRAVSRVIPEEVARQITLFLADPVARLPSFPRLGWLEYPFPVAVKTGTSQGFRDAWCVAYSQKYIVGAWVGHPENAPMKRRCGADSAAMVVHKVMASLHPEEMKGFSDLAFPAPQGHVARRIDMLSGKAAREDTPYVALEWFKPGAEPVELTDVYQDVQLDALTGRPAGIDCPVERRQPKRYVSLPPRYAAWAKESGLELPPLDFGAFTLQLRQEPELAVLSPRHNTRFVDDPETPRDQATIALEATVSPPAPQVVWYVDGKLLCVADYPYTARWRTTPGAHVFQVGLPYAPLRSPRVRVNITN